MTSIKHLEAIEVLDSRGNPTVKVKLTTDSGLVAESFVPSGASTGEKEAYELRDHDKTRFSGKGVLKACYNVNHDLNRALVGVSLFDQKRVDQMMIELDGTPHKSRLGANAILGVSMAYAKACAIAKKEPLYSYLLEDDAYILPTPMINILNGGAHADNALVFQESMIRPIGAKSFKEAMIMATGVFHSLKKILKAHSFSTGVGDEGGFAPNVGSLNEALSLIVKAIYEAGYEPKKDITIALDAAASEFYDKDAKGYNLAKSGPAKILKPLEMIEFYQELCEKFPIDSIEDPLDQNDWEHWKIITEKVGKKIQIVGDDIFCTNPSIIKKAIQDQIANAVLIKPNQIGTLSETLDAIRLAKAHRMGCVMSHRSGETEDAILADLAVGFGAHQIKTGSVCRSERVAKYNRLIEIEHELGSKATYYGANR